MKLFKIVSIVSVILFITGCSTLTLTPAEFGWPLEVVLKVDNNGFVREERYAISFNTTALFFEETKDSLGYAGKSLRIIRNVEGFYFITAQDFKNVYVFNVEKNSLVLENTILISETGMKNPVFNQRKPFIELIAEGKSLRLTSNGIEEGVK